MKLCYIVIFLLSAGISQAQYLTTYNNTALRVDHHSGADQVIGGDMKPGEILELLDSGQQNNGYYHAKILGTNIKGWIYRSQVKRESGQLPRFYPNKKGAEVYVVDVGAGLGCIIKTPEGKYIIYDGGNSDYVNTFLNSLYPVGQDIELMILSHTDSDHWRAVDEITADYQIKRALFTSYRPDGLPGTVKGAIDSLKAEPGIVIQDLTEAALTPGTVVYSEGDFSLTFLSGFGKRDEAFAAELGNNASKLRNAASIVIKLDYADQSVLFTGDIVGLDECKKADCACEYECISTERFLLDSMSQYLESSVIIAPHHGARNASCPRFIEAVNAEYVIFSAGNTHKHPHQLTATNYQSYGGVPLENIYRTDVGKAPIDTDSNPCNNEWIGRNNLDTETDGSFDDHIRIQITEAGRLLVGYLR
ncbi:MBL fold metallo-hydrolase [Reichenbachiella agarivorans]|uniref:MBL fold metallo-hydrolase n=1 Tax=Reichenbachiella agarivorans TaxID=2979464 RepID=A0ABY6CMN6_9BACT|nr:MBL fold metallo-hydrolase [Reichenbachiella agarivorans]UXP31639.1 MBL fold metallo-hydrolase [Reichenbachiella agarivorans]